MTLCNYVEFKITNIPHYCEYQWIIENFSSVRQDLYSPVFCVASGCLVKWKALLELKNRMAMKFYMVRNEVTGLKVKLSYKMSGEQELIKQDSFEDIYPLINKYQGIEITKPQYMSHRGWLVNGHYKSVSSDTLRLEITLTISNCCQNEDPNSYLTKGNIPQLQIDFKSLFKDQNFTDVALNCGTEVIRVHKCVLCARSPVFRKMFEQNLKENIYNTVEIDDIEKEVLETFLVFLYTGLLEDSNFKTVAGIYYAADKYEVPTLQATCCKTLISYISKDTVTDILKLADMHSDTKLKQEAIVYICAHFREVESTSEWRQLIDTEPRLASYVLMKVSRSMIN